MHQGSHGGDIYRAAQILGIPVAEIGDYSSNVSHIQPSILKELNFAELISVLPEPNSRTLQKAYAGKNGIGSENVCVTAGTTEAIDAVCRIYSGRRVTIDRPCYSDYARYARLHGLIEGRGADLAFICSPNNPTGASLPRESILKRAADNPYTMFVIDESYMPFHLRESEFSLLNCGVRNIVVLRSFSKIFCAPGLRLGFLVSANADFVQRVTESLSLWNVNTPAQAAGLLLSNEDSKPAARAAAEIKTDFLKNINDISWLEPLSSDVNFVLCRLHGKKSADIFLECFKRRVLIRDCGNFEGLEGEHIRFSVKADMQPLYDAFRSIA